MKILSHMYPWTRKFLLNLEVIRIRSPDAHHACASCIMHIELLEKGTPEFIPHRLWPPNSPDLNPVDYGVWGILQRRCTKHASLTWTIDDAIDEWLPQ